MRPCGTSGLLSLFMTPSLPVASRTVTAGQWKIYWSECRASGATRAPPSPHHTAPPPRAEHCGVKCSVEPAPLRAGSPVQSGETDEFARGVRQKWTTSARFLSCFREFGRCPVARLTSVRPLSVSQSAGGVTTGRRASVFSDAGGLIPFHVAR
ncbi:hypothetical protein J6590_012625 [Homalodisca vitripennis]|nr:hypothetical protein J6590_012625 [Homalodisca vitripennis]